MLEPASYAGVTLGYDGKKLTVYYPRANYAVVFEGLPAPSPEDERKLIAETYRHNQDTFRYQLGSGSIVAGLPTIKMSHAAKPKSWLSQKGVVQVYDKYSLLLASDLDFAGGARYSFWFSDIAFDEPLDDASFAVPLPKNCVVSRWDLTSTGIPERELREQANFELSPPTLHPGRPASRPRAVSSSRPVTTPRAAGGAASPTSARPAVTATPTGTPSSTPSALA